jgi:hypothetical protein
LIKLVLLAAAVAGAGYYWFYVRRPDSTLDRIRDAAGSAGERIGEAAGAARSAAGDAAERVKDAART